MLQFIIKCAQYLQGIGAGSSVESSGERGVLVHLASKHKNSYCVFDVGANQGQFAGLVLSVLGDKVELQCFEPSPSTFEILCIAMQPHGQVKLNNVALGKNIGSASLYSNKVGSGLASLTRRRLDHFGVDFSRVEDVVVDTLDNFCISSGISHIDLLKVDVEGHELDVLYGAESMFKANAIDMVTFEFGGCNIDTRTFFQDFFYFFSGINMVIYRVTPSGSRVKIDKYSEILEQFRTTNFLAVRKDYIGISVG